VTTKGTTAEIEADFAAAGIPNARINTVPQAREMPAIASKLTRTHLPDGREIRMQPMAVDMPHAKRDIAFPPKYGEHTDQVLIEAGFSEADCRRFREAGISA